MRDLEYTLRPRQDRDGAEIARRAVGLAPAGQLSFVGRVDDDAKQPTAPGYYYLVNPVSVLGPEVEGATANLVADMTRTVIVCVIGTKGPSAGDDLVCKFVENRWVAERYGATSPPPPPPPPTIPGCTCSVIPGTLTMSSSGPCVPSDFQACTIVWQPTPSWASGLALGSNCFLSTARLLDPFTGGYFYYNLNCDTIYFRLSRVYDGTTNYGFTGTPYQDATIYTWQIGEPGNSCSPFLLSVGTIYPGGNDACVVTISE